MAPPHKSDRGREEKKRRMSETMGLGNKYAAETNRTTFTVPLSVHRATTTGDKTKTVFPIAHELNNRHNFPFYCLSAIACPVAGGRAVLRVLN